MSLDKNKAERILQVITLTFERAATLATAVAEASEALRVVEEMEEYTKAVTVVCRSARFHLLRGEYEVARDAAIALTELRTNDEVRAMHKAFCAVCNAAASHETEVRGLVAVSAWRSQSKPT